jgi:hypothetical protein
MSGVTAHITYSIYTALFRLWACRFVRSALVLTENMTAVRLSAQSPATGVLTPARRVSLPGGSWRVSDITVI